MRDGFTNIYNLLKEGSYRSYGVILFIFGCFVLVLTYVSIRISTLKSGEFIGGVMIEMYGMLFDILVLGLIFRFYQQKGDEEREKERKSRELQEKILRYNEEIRDFRGWDEKEAMFRVVGIIKRLKKLGVNDLSLKRSYLKEAKLSYMDFQKAKFQEANLEQANLRESDLRGAKLQGGKLKDSILQGANLQNADLRWTDLQEAYLLNAILQGANLCEANLKNADLRRTILKNAQLREANLQGAKLINADFFEADLRDAILHQADLTRAENLTLEQLMQVKTLYGSIGLEPGIEKELRTKKPGLFRIPEEK